MKECWLCGRNGAGDPLDRHHIFGGAYRAKSEKQGLTVYLCHKRCHESGKKAVHVCAETAEQLHKYGQAKAMLEQGWDVERFRAEFGRNYLEPGEIAEIEDNGPTRASAPTGSRRNPAKRIRREEEEQRSERAFAPRAEARRYGACDDEVPAPAGGGSFAVLDEFLPY